MSCSGGYVKKPHYGSTIAPVKKISFSNPMYPDRPIEREALLDSGASNTMIPRDVAEELALQQIRTSKAYDYEGTFIGEEPVYVVSVSCDSMIKNVEAVETRGGAIIGRDILNTIKFSLDARRNRWEMS